MKVRLMILSLLWPACRNSILAANVAEGTHKGAVTRLADAVISTKNLVVKIGSDEDHIAAAGVSDIPLGVCTDEADAIGDEVNVNLLGSAQETQLGVASGAIAAGDMIVPGAGGTVRTLPASSGTYYIIGRALKAAADGGNVEFDPCLPVQRVI